MDYLEGVFGDSANKHAKELQAFKDSHTKLLASHGLPGGGLWRLGQQACQGAPGLQGLAHEAPGIAWTTWRGSLATRPTSMPRSSRPSRTRTRSSWHRMDYLEGVFGDSANKHAKELQAFKDSHT